MGLFNHQPGPDGVEQLAFRRQSASPLDQADEKIEGARTQHRSLARDQQSTLDGTDLETAKTVSGVHGPPRWVATSATGAAV